MCFRIRLLKQRFLLSFFFFLHWAHCQLHCSKPSVEGQLQMAPSPNVSLEKEVKAGRVGAEIEGAEGRNDLIQCWMTLFVGVL